MHDKPLGMEIQGLAHLMRRRTENFKSLQCAGDVSGTNSRIIFFLANHPEEDIFQRDIEQRFSITRSTASKVVRLMEQKGLIERRGVERDLRLKKLVLTDKALKLHRETGRDYDQLESDLVRGFSETEFEQVYSFVKRMKENMKSPPAL